MRITVLHTSATSADIAGYTTLHSMYVAEVTEVTEVTVVPSPRIRIGHAGPRPARRRKVAPVTAGSAPAGRSGVLEIAVVHSSRNRTGGGARARPALATVR